jgi:NAD+ kinase
VTNVVIVAHHERAEVPSLALEVCRWLDVRGHKAWLLPEDAEALGLEELGSDTDPATADLAVSLGGDGTVLRTAQLVDGVPILSVNVGLLGYLTEVEPPGIAEALERWLAGSFIMEPRMLLDISLERAGTGAPERYRALNEAVIEKRESGHTVRLLVSIAGVRFISYATDGLIVATPTGSTAYSLSARGPIVSPQIRAIVLTPVSPHMLFDRPLVLDPEEPVTVEMLGHRPADLSVDGRRVAGLSEGDTVTCRADPDVARFVRFGHHRFHQILKTKFGLSDR